MVSDEKPSPSGTFHSTFGGIFFQSKLSPLSRLMPSRCGPRNWGHQSLASGPWATARPGRMQANVTAARQLRSKNFNIKNLEEQLDLQGGRVRTRIRPGSTT